MSNKIGLKVENEKWGPQPFSEEPRVNMIVGYQFEPNCYYLARITKIWEYTVDLETFLDSNRAKVYLNIEEGGVTGTFRFLTEPEFVGIMKYGSTKG